jgi:hypothetical protein
MQRRFLTRAALVYQGQSSDKFARLSHDALSRICSTCIEHFLTIRSLQCQKLTLPKPRVCFPTT